MTNTQIKEQDFIEFKADFFPITVIKLTSTNPAFLKSQIATTLAAAPNYFKNAPVVLDVNQIEGDANLSIICEILKAHHMIPVGVKGLEKSQEEQARALGLAMMKTSRSAEKKSEPSLTSGQPGAAKKEKTESLSTSPTKIVNQPIRSGSQIYARGGDLVITAAVNAGGECIADGNIHIYGPLRGKALAGATGNAEAKIFCQQLEAELVSIAGHYLTSEQISGFKSDKTMIQIYLKDGKIRLESI